MTRGLARIDELSEPFENIDPDALFPRPRIAVLCAMSGLGGAEISLLELVAQLRDTYEFHLIVPGEGPFQQSAEEVGATVWTLPWPAAISGMGETARRPSMARMLGSAAYLFSFARKLSKLLEEIGPSVFVTNAIKAHAHRLPRTQTEGCSLDLVHARWIGDRVFSRKLLALLSPRCGEAVCVSRYIAAQFREYVSPSVPASVVNDIVDLNRFRPGALRPADMRKKPGEICFGIIGAITPLKGQDIFLDAAEEVLGELPDANFAIVGNNPYATEKGSSYEEQLRQRVANSALRDRVKFVGFRSDVPNVLSHLDVVVQPNRGPEGLGRSVLEAMACGVPVIAVNKWGPAELIQHGKTGLLFSPLDTAQLSAHMLTLGKDLVLRKTIGKQGYDWIQSNLISEDLARKVDHILAAAIASHLPEVAA